MVSKRAGKLSRVSVRENGLETIRRDDLIKDQGASQLVEAKAYSYVHTVTCLLQSPLNTLGVTARSDLCRSLSSFSLM